jgi:hypothetical protein
MVRLCYNTVCINCLRLSQGYGQNCSYRGRNICLRREYHNYGFSEIASSPFIRALRDTVWSPQNQNAPSCLVFEWMDHDLKSVTAPEFRGSPILPKVVSKEVLSALDILKILGAVHTGSCPHAISPLSTNS